MSVESGVSGIVLAGGMSRRLGRDKVVEPVGGQPLIQRVIHRLSQVTDEVMVVVNESDRAVNLPLPDNVRVAADVYPGKGTLGGMFTGLNDIENQWGVIVACDMPFLNIRLIRHMLSVREGFDVVVPVLRGYLEPTHAAYSKECLPHIERKLKADHLKIIRFFDEVRVNTVPEEDIHRLDPGFLSFFNINTQQDLDEALGLADMGH